MARRKKKNDEKNIDFEKDIDTIDTQEDIEYSFPVGLNDRERLKVIHKIIFPLLKSLQDKKFLVMSNQLYEEKDGELFITKKGTRFISKELKKEKLSIIEEIYRKKIEDQINIILKELEGNVYREEE